MRKNIFLKSAVRQLVRTLLLAILVGVATFAFVARVVEYRVVTGEIARIEEFYHSVGFLQHPDFVPSARRFQQIMPPYQDVNTTEAAEIISQSSYLAFDDSRRFVQGELPEGKSNANFNTYGAPILGERGIHYIYFYGIFDSRPGGGTDRATGLKYRHIIIDVDQIVSGFPEHMYEGERVRIVSLAPEGLVNPTWSDVTTPFDTLVPGERYFFKASLRWWMIVQNPPATGRLDPHPITTDMGEVWYIPAPVGEDLDFSDPSLASLANEIETNIINQRTMHVVGTTDMSDMPVFHPDAYTYILESGRFIDHDDYLNANHVAVVGHEFAEYHGLEIGDTITLTLRDMQSPVIPYGYYDWREIPTQEVEYTIVGTHDRHFRFRLLIDVGDEGHVGEHGGTDAFPTTFTNAHIYVPLSTLPDGFGGDPSDYGLRDYSFVLASARYERNFIAENSEALRELGFEVIFFEHGGERFFDSADHITLSVTTNLAVSSLVSLLVLSLSGFMILHQNRRNFAIQRALGVPSLSILIRNLLVTMLFWLPAIVVGGYFAWNFALSQSQETLIGLAEFSEYIEFDYYADIYADLFATPSMNILVVLCAAFAAVAFSLVFFGGVKILNRPVLELLQGKRTGGFRASRKSLLVLLQGMSAKDKDISNSDTQNEQDIDLQSLQLSQIIALDTKQTKSTRLRTFSRSSMRFVWRHIIRVPIKSLLTVFSAMFFVVALIWLQVTIDRTAEEIEVLYDTMPITAEIQAVDVVYPLWAGEMITKETVDTIMGDEFVRDAYILAGISYANIVPADDDGEFSRENLYDVWFDFADQFAVDPDEVRLQGYHDDVYIEDPDQDEDYDDENSYDNGEHVNDGQDLRDDDNYDEDEGYEYQQEALIVYTDGWGDDDDWDEEQYRAPWHLTTWWGVGWGMPRTAEGDVEWWLFEFDYLFALNCLETFITESQLSYAMVWGGEPFEHRFIEGFDISDFGYDDPTLTQPIPVVLHQDLLERRNLSLGDVAYISFEIGNDLRAWSYPFMGVTATEYPVHIVGTYRGHTIGSLLHPADEELVIMPLDALQYIRGDYMTYMMLRVEIDPARNHELAEFEERVGEIIGRNGIQRDEWSRMSLPLRMTIDDDEFRQIVIPLEHNLELLEILYPIAIVAAVILGTGLSLMLMLQHTKNAAAMRVLGSTRRRIRVLLCVELLIVNIIGIVLALSVVPLLDLGFDEVFFRLAGVYLAGVIVGGIIGAIVVSRRTPLELLQVRE